MSIKKKLLFLYLSLIGGLLAVIGFGYYSYLSAELENRAKSNLESMSAKLGQQFDNVIRPLDFSLTNLLSDERFMNAMNTLVTIKRTEENRAYIEDATREISDRISTYANAKNFYRISVYNTKGDFISNDGSAKSIVEDAMQQLIKLTGEDDLIENIQLDKKIIPNHMELWVENSRNYVMSLIRIVTNSKGEATCIETEILEDKIEETFSILKDEGIQVIVFDENEKIIYYDSKETLKSAGYYKKIIEQLGTEAVNYRNTVNYKNELISKVYSDYTKVNVITIQNREVINRPIKAIRNFMIIAGLFIFGISLLFYFLMLDRFMKPLKELKEEMETTELYNLPYKTTIETTENEIISLNKSYNKLKNRLNTAVNKEMEAQKMQMQASMDLLQAQVNPHFIYNVMNIISYRGLVLGDEEIGQMCEGITSMLRYSTSNIKREAYIYEEINHISNYLMLMKKRYEECIGFHIEVEEKIKRQEIPKIILQIFIENAIVHSFEKGIRSLHIKVKGYEKDDRWHLLIEDNGGGFAEERKRQVLQNIKEAEKRLAENKEQLQLKIGEMGIISAYIRLKIFFKEDLGFHIYSEDNKAIISISAAMIRGDDDE